MIISLKRKFYLNPLIFLKIDKFAIENFRPLDYYKTRAKEEPEDEDDLPF
jgi:hypothetical protein